MFFQFIIFRILTNDPLGSRYNIYISCIYYIYTYNVYILYIQYYFLMVIFKNRVFFYSSYIFFFQSIVHSFPFWALLLFYFCWSYILLDLIVSSYWDTSENSMQVPSSVFHEHPHSCGTHAHTQNILSLLSLCVCVAYSSIYRLFILMCVHEEARGGCWVSFVRILYLTF